MMNRMNPMGGNGMNPIKLIQTLQQAKGNPIAVMEQMMGNNPQFQRVMQMTKGKAPKELREIAMNLCQNSGVNFEQAVSSMRKMGLNIPEDINTPENAK